MYRNTALKIKQNLPNAITILRLVTLPFIAYSFANQIKIVPFCLFLFSISTDFLDGYVARKLECTSKLGSYFDVTIDFLFITGVYLTFSLKEIYSPWLLLIIVVAFMVFWLLGWIYSTSVDPPLTIIGVVAGVVINGIYIVPLVIMLKYLRGDKVKNAIAGISEGTDSPDS